MNSSFHPYAIPASFLVGCAAAVLLLSSYSTTSDSSHLHAAPATTLRGPMITAAHIPAPYQHATLSRLSAPQVPTMQRVSLLAGAPHSELNTAVVKRQPLLTSLLGVVSMTLAVMATILRLKSRNERRNERLVAQWAMVSTAGETEAQSALNLVTSSESLEAQLQALGAAAEKAAKASQVAADFLSKELTNVAAATQKVIQSVDYDQVYDTAQKAAKVSQAAAEVVGKNLAVAAAVSVEKIKSVDVDEVVKNVNTTAADVNKAATPVVQTVTAQANKVLDQNPWVTTTINDAVDTYFAQAQIVRDQLPLIAQPYFTDEVAVAGGALLVFTIAAGFSAALDALLPGERTEEWDLAPDQVDLMLRGSDALLVDIRSPEETQAGVPDLQQTARSKAVLISPSNLPPQVRQRTADPAKVEQRLHVMTVRNLRRVQNATSVIIMDSNGSRGRAFAQLLRDNGIPLVYYMRGGYAKWRASGLGVRETYDVAVTELVKQELAALVGGKDNVLGRLNSLLNTNQAKLLGLGAGLSAVLSVNL